MAASPRRLRIRRLVGLVLITVTMSYALWIGLLLLSQRRMLFARHYANARLLQTSGPPGSERLTIATPSGTVEAWLLPALGRGQQEPGPAVLFAHGNAELIDDWPHRLEPYRRMGLHLLLPEFRGYGRSAGSPSQEAITADMIRFVDLLAARPAVDGRRILFHGRSLGGGVVCGLARHRRPVGMILESTFSSVRAFARDFGAPGFLVFDPFDNQSTVAALDVPLLIIHGRRDDQIPFAHGRLLQKAARRSELLALDCAHNDCPPDPRKYWAAIAAFVKKALREGPRAGGLRDVSTAL